MKVNAVSGETEDDKPMTPRRSFWKVGLALFGLVVLLLGGAFALNARLRPAIGIDRVTSNMGPAPTNVIGVTPTAVLPGALDRSAALTPGSSVTVTPQLPPGVHLATSPQEKEIESAYLHYWEVRSNAEFNLDDSHLADVMAGPELARAQQQIKDLKAQGRAIKVDIQHNLIAFGPISADQATLYDEYLNRSVYIDPVSKKEFPTSAPPEVEKIIHTLKKINGTWKVFDGMQPAS